MNPTGDAITPEQEAAPIMKPIKDDLFNYDKAKPRMQKRITDWQKHQTQAISNRRTRNIDVSIASMRQKGELKPDETFLPQRLVDTNIKREMPAWLKFITGSRRLVTFMCPTQRTLDCQELEMEFKRGMSYSKWEIPHIKGIDGAQTQGVDYCEVVFDESKPLHVGIEHIGYENLLFNEATLDIQQDEFILRVYEWTPSYLRSCVAKYGFDAKEVQEILDTEIKEDLSKIVLIYKKLFKFEGVVYVAWARKDGNKWLKAPMPLNIGISEQVTTMMPQQQPIIDPLTGAAVVDAMTGQPAMQTIEVPVTEWVDSQIGLYPVFPIIYMETEERALLQHKGCVYRDKYKQEAQTVIATQFVNKLSRSNNVYSSAKTPDVSGGSMKQLATELVDGTILSQPVDFYSPPEPNPLALAALQYFAGVNAEEAGSITMQAQKKTDRAPATAYIQAEAKEADLDSVQLVNLSTYIRDMYSFVWLIVQSQALQEKITFLAKEDGTNDLERIGLKYEVRAAGDIDVVERGNKLRMMLQFWPIVANIPALAQVFLKNMLALAFPEDTGVYGNILDSIPTDKTLIAQLWAMLQAMISPEELSALTPQQQLQLQQLSMMVQQSLGQTAAGGPSQGQQGDGAESAQVSGPSQQPQIAAA